MSPWFDGPLPRILAHRGLALEAPENTVAAFTAAVAAGATHVETDARATSDGVVVLVHDARLPDGREIADVPLAALREAMPQVATLAESLAALPDTPFNVDVKHPAAAVPTATAARAAGVGRVLITSFSRRRRLGALRLAPGAPTSASSDAVAVAAVGIRFRLFGVPRVALRGVQAVQIPERALGADLSTPWAIRAMHAAGVEVHFWVVNDASRMRELVARGADGIVTDRADIARDALR